MKINRFPAFILLLVLFVSMLSHADSNFRESVLTDEEVSFLEDMPPLRVPIISKQPPLSFFENNTRSGYLNDLFELVAERLGLKVQPINGLSYSESLQAIKNLEVDLLNDYSSHGPKRDFVMETRPVHVSPFVVVGRVTDKNIREINDLADKRLVLVKGFQQTRSIQDKYPEFSVLLVNNIDEAYKALRSNDADYYIDNATHAGYYVTKYLVSDLSIKGELSKRELGALSLHFAVRSDYPLLHSAIQKTLDSLTTTDYERLRSKWLATNTDNKSLRLTESEINWLSQHKTIRLLVDPSWAPIEYVDNEGQFKGLSIDYLEKLEALLGIEFVLPTDLSWSEGVEKFKRKELDMASSVSKTAEREKYSLFTDPYISIPIGIFARQDVSYIGSLEALKDKKIAVSKGYAVEEWLKRDHPELAYYPVASPREGLQQVSDGDVDVYIGNIMTTTYYIGKYEMSNVQLSGETPYKNNQRMAVRNDWPEFKVILQKALNSISKEEHSKIYTEWMGIRFERAVDYELVWWIASIATIALFLVFYWNRKLEREVASRTHKLTKSEEKYRHLADNLEKQVALRTAQFEEAKNTAELANKEKSRFLANMSHELRTPMHAILSFSNLGIKHIKDEKIKGYLEKIHSSGDRLTTLLDNLLDLSKLEAGKLTPEFKENNLTTVALSSIDEVSSLLSDKNIAIKMDENTSLTGCFDSKLITQVLVNILSNAIKFSTNESTIEIVLHRNALETDKHLSLSVIDEGIGIPQNELDDVFDSFVQSSKTRSKSGGTGLGLPISKEIIDLHHGKIWAESPPKDRNKGATFTFYIPVNQTSKDCHKDND
jgi:signal transduction histidine kinase/membrane-bound lytic murein transglycosylase MltF